MNRIAELKEQIKEERERAFLNANSKEEVIEIWETDKRVRIPDNAKIKFCRGCREDYYNYHSDGGCWCLSMAKLKKKKIYPTLDSVKPDEVITLDCYKQEYH